MFQTKEAADIGHTNFHLVFFGVFSEHFLVLQLLIRSMFQIVSIFCLPELKFSAIYVKCYLQ